MRLRPVFISVVSWVALLVLLEVAHVHARSQLSRAGRRGLAQAGGAAAAAAAGASGTTIKKSPPPPPPPPPPPYFQGVIASAGNAAAAAGNIGAVAQAGDALAVAPFFTNGAYASTSGNPYTVTSQNGYSTGTDVTPIYTTQQPTYTEVTPVYTVPSNSNAAAGAAVSLTPLKKTPSPPLKKPPPPPPFNPNVYAITGPGQAAAGAGGIQAIASAG